MGAIHEYEVSGMTVIYGLDGKVVKSHVEDLAPGVYIVREGKKVRKVVIR